MPYFISPQSSPISHKVTLQANLSTAPSVPAGHTIEWRKNGVTIKSGSTSDPFYLTINSAADATTIGGVVFTAEDTGSYIDFLIDPTPGPPLASQTVVLSNNLPVLSGAGPVTDSYSIAPQRPTLVWTYSDADSDAQFFFRARFGSTPGGSEFYDSGTIFSTVQTFAYPISQPVIPHGTIWYWTIDVGDGEKINPFDPSPTPARVLVTASGTSKINSLPVVSNVLVDGLAAGTIHNATPTISWTHTDVDAQPQQSYRIIVARDIGLTSVLWDSGTITGAAASAVYNFNLTGITLEAHVTLYVGVYATDTFETSAVATTTFIESNPPVITTLTVDSKVNPLNIRDLTPFFNWLYTNIDLDSSGEPDPLVAYEIRVGDNDTDLGTDSFLGNIWNPGVVFSPESYGVQFNVDGTAFPGCGPTHTLLPNIKYFFQVQIQDAFGISEWASGFFKLNSPPTAANLVVIPAAPFNSDDLFSIYDFVDDIGDVESDLTQIRWFRKAVGATGFSEVVDLRNERTVPNVNTIPQDLWKFTVRPHDGTEYSLLTYESASVTILNRAPTASALALLPSSPKTADNLQAIFALSDPDEDAVSARISWYKNGVEVIELRNATVIPASVTSVDEEWYFTIQPYDGYDFGPVATSPKVKILNTPPQISSMSIDGQIFPRQVKDPNPTIGWTYQDDDLQPQQKYHVIVGTRPARSKKILTNLTRALPISSAGTGLALTCGGDDGIISTCDGNGILVAGNEIFDTDVVESTDNFYQYITSDFVKPILLNAISLDNVVGFTISTDLQTLLLQPGLTSATATGKFLGLPSFYDVELTYVKDDKKSTYRLIVDGVAVGQFTSQPGSGTDTYTFNAVRIETSSVVGIVGIATDTNAKARFRQILCTPISQLELAAGSFTTLSGYLQDGVGGIKLAGLAGTATTKFTFPSGTYDIEFVYVTESNGNPVVTLAQNSSVLLNFTYESGAKTRSRFLAGVSITRGDTFKISGTRNAGALARVKEVIFRPTSTTKVGAKLKDGLQYYASVRVFDGRDWSDWSSTTFTMNGSAWASQVANAQGWTIEARFKVKSLATPTASLTQEIPGQQTQALSF